MSVILINFFRTNLFTTLTMYYFCCIVYIINSMKWSDIVVVNLRNNLHKANSNLIRIMQSLESRTLVDR